MFWRLKADFVDTRDRFLTLLYRTAPKAAMPSSVPMITITPSTAAMVMPIGGEPPMEIPGGCVEFS